MVRPLQKRPGRDDAYHRPPTVEAAIGVALRQDLKTILTRATIRDFQSPDHLASEVLVYLIRDAARQEDENRFNRLLKMLLDRCEANLAVHVAEGAFPDPVALREDILADFAGVFVRFWAEPDSGALDFYEVRFNKAFRTFRIDRLRAEARRLPPTRTPPGETDPDGPELTVSLPPDEALSRLAASDPLASGLLVDEAPEKLAFRNELADAISELPPDERDAIIFHYYYGYEIESTDRRKRTVAKLCDVTGKTVRNRISRALEKLKRLTQ